MHNLTEGSISRHLLVMAVPMAIGMVVQTMYYLVDLYFVARLGDTAIAGVSAAGNATFIILALAQMLTVGTVTMVSHAVGKKDREQANLVFNQSVVLAGLFALATLLVGYLMAGRYMQSLGADAETIQAGKTYLY